MAKDVAIRIKFMFDRSSLPSQRDYELQSSEARSHIAKVVHTRKKRTSLRPRKEETIAV